MQSPVQQPHVCPCLHFSTKKELKQYISKLLLPNMHQSVLRLTYCQISKQVIPLFWYLYIQNKDTSTLHRERIPKNRNIGTAAIHICDSILSLTIISKKFNGKNIQINPIYTPVTYLFNLQPINIQHNKVTKPIIITIFSSLQISTLKLFIIQSFSVLIYSITQACYLLYYL